MNNLVTCLILTKNEEKNIKRAIESAKLVTNNIYVIDSLSSDKTVQIAQECGASVIQHPFETHGKQFNWAMEQIDIQTPWIMRLDADEEITKELADEILNNCAEHLNDDVNGLVFKFKIYFLNKFLKHGGMYPFYRLSVFKTGIGFIDENGMRDQTLLKHGKMVYLKNDCLHFDYKTLEQWVYKHVWYSSMEFKNLCDRFDFKKGKRTSTSTKTNFFRDKIYYKLPMFFRAKLYYIYIYYFKLGFLDGKAGKIHAFFQAYWYRYLIDARIYEFKKSK